MSETPDLIARLDDVVDRYQRGITVTDAEASNDLYEARAVLVQMQQARDNQAAVIQSLSETTATKLREAEARVRGLEQDIEAFNRCDHDRDGAAMVWCDLYREERVARDATDEALTRLEQEIRDFSIIEQGVLRTALSKWADTLRALRAGDGR